MDPSIDQGIAEYINFFMISILFFFFFLTAPCTNINWFILLQAEHSWTVRKSNIEWKCVLISLTFISVSNSPWLRSQQWLIYLVSACIEHTETGQSLGRCMLHATFLVIVIKVDKNHRGCRSELAFAALKKVCNVLHLLRSKNLFMINYARGMWR